MKKTIWFNFPYLIMCIIIIISVSIFLSVDVPKNMKEGSYVELFCGVGYMPIMLYFTVKMSPRLVLTDKGIYYKEFFKKSSFNDYSEYRFIKKAYYGYYDNPIYYIVLSKRQLSGDELCHINNVPMSETVIHIRFNEKNYNAFMKILPQKQAEMLEKEFKTMRAPKINFIP